MFDDAQRADQRPWQAFIADFEVDWRALRLRAPVFVGGHLYGAEGVGFGAGVGGLIFHDLPACSRRILFGTATALLSIPVSAMIAS
jgi:hypothetical protein